MIAAAATSATQGLSFSWFDMVVVVVLGFGVFRGRRNGMAKELLPTLEWLVVVAASGLGCPLLAKLLTSLISNPLWNHVAAYLALALAVFIVFEILKQKAGEKLGQSDLFKSGEYYLGMMAGMIRYACVLLFVLALVNARIYSPVDIAAEVAHDKQDFGGGIYQGNYFPHLFQIQKAVFNDSFAGRFIKHDLGLLLINTGPGGADGSQPPKKQPIIKIG